MKATYPQMVASRIKVLCFLAKGTERTQSRRLLHLNGKRFSLLTFRKTAKQAMQSHIRIFVGRRTQAKAARSRHRRNLQRSASGPTITGQITHLAKWSASLDSTASEASILSFSVPLAGPPGALRNHCHGHSDNAAIVNEVSVQFDNVRVEQNHCQGLKVVKASYAGRVGNGISVIRYAD